MNLGKIYIDAEISTKYKKCSLEERYSIYNTIKSQLNQQDMDYEEYEEAIKKLKTQLNLFF